MAACTRCGTPVKKIMFLPGTSDLVCAKCAQKVESYPFTDEELQNDSTDDQRGALRIPISIGLHFKAGKSDMVMTYPATTVNISTSGICFAWGACPGCHGYEENGVDKRCFFYPYSVKVKEKKRLGMELILLASPAQKVELQAHVVYTLKDEDIGIEYVGASFHDLTPEKSRFLESLLVKFGSSAE